LEAVEEVLLLLVRIIAEAMPDLGAVVTSSDAVLLALSLSNGKPLEFVSDGRLTILNGATL
jgi:hypothetical protein